MFLARLSICLVYPAILMWRCLRNLKNTLRRMLDVSSECSAPLKDALITFLKRDQRSKTKVLKYP